MTLSTAMLIIFALSAYSYFLVRRAAYVQGKSIIPFLTRVHLPNVMDVLTSKEHDIIHNKIDIINLRILTCFIAAILSVGLSLFFLVLVAYGGDGRIPGYLMAVLFAYLVANYDLNSKAVSWIKSVENDVLARIIVKKSDAAGFDNLADYFKAENDKMIADFYDEMAEVADEFEQMMIEEGYDPNKDYDADDNFEEFINILERSTQKMNEKYPERAEKYNNSVEE